MGDYRNEMEVFDRVKQHDKDFFIVDKEKFLRDLDSPYVLYNMDDLNRHLGATVKFWWRGLIGDMIDRTILDAGGGNSYHSPYWLSKGNRVVLSDVSAEALRINRRTFDMLGLHGRLVQNNVENLCFKDGTFDVVNMNLFLHHVSNIPKALKNAYGAIKDGGRILIVEPNHYFPFRFMYECSFLRKYNPINNFLVRTNRTGRDDKGVAYSKLINDVREAGFSIQYIGYDRNFLGYPFGYFFPKMKPLLRIIYYFDRIVTLFLPKFLTNFIYIIGEKRPAA